MNGNIRSLGEIMAAENERSKWGGWVLLVDALVLEHDGYEIDLERCLTSAQVLDWIAHIAGKDWATDAILAGLVRALGDVLDPQRTLCPFGSPKSLTRHQVADLARKAKGEVTTP